MNKHILLLCSLLSIQIAVAEEVYLPNLKKNATGTTTGSKSGLDVYISGGSLGSVLSGNSAAVGDSGTPAWAVRKDSEGIISGIDESEYTPLQVDSNGRLKVDAAVSEVATAADGSSSLPTTTKVVSGWDGSNVQVLKTDSTGSLQVDVESSALPSGAATSANQTTANASLSSIDGKLSQDFGVSSAAVRTAAILGNASGALDYGSGADSAQTVRVSANIHHNGTDLAYNAGNASAQTLRTVIATDQSAIPASQSGTWNINDISGTISLPTGAATAARQDTGNTSLGNIDTDTTTIATNTTSLDGKVANNYGAATGAVRTAAQVGNASGVADFNAGNASAQTLRTVIATDQSALPVSQSGTWSVRTQDGSGNATTSSAAGSTRPIDVAVRDSAGNLVNPVTFGTSGSQSNATVSTVITLTAPANAMGFLLTNLDTSTANIRWAVGATASASVGTQLQPGRDTGFIPAGADISVCSESGTQNYSVQWLIK